MAGSETCWTLIRGAAQGGSSEREAFARRYETVVRAFLETRWRRSRRIAEVADAVQEVFLECLRQGGALEKADPRYPGGFRGFLYGITRNVALRFETRAARRAPAVPDVDLDLIEGDESALSQAFDRAWAHAVMFEAAALHAKRAEAEGGEGKRRIDLLRLHFGEGLQIKDIAARWGEDPAALYRQHRQARAEFKEALFEVLGFHHPGSRREIEEECAHLLSFFG